jgi:hypothetical protein
MLVARPRFFGVNVSFTNSSAFMLLAVFLVASFFVIAIWCVLCGPILARQQIASRIIN